MLHNHTNIIAKLLFYTYRLFCTLYMRVTCIHGMTIQTVLFWVVTNVSKHPVTPIFCPESKAEQQVLWQYWYRQVFARHHKYTVDHTLTFTAMKTLNLILYCEHFKWTIKSVLLTFLQLFHESRFCYYFQILTLRNIFKWRTSYKFVSWLSHGIFPFVKFWSPP